MSEPSSSQSSSQPTTPSPHVQVGPSLLLLGSLVAPVLVLLVLVSPVAGLELADAVVVLLVGVELVSLPGPDVLTSPDCVLTSLDCALVVDDVPVPGKPDG